MIDRFRRVLAVEHAFEALPEDDLGSRFPVPPRIIVRPPDAESCAAALAVAGELRAPVVPWGGGQHQDQGNVPSPVEVLLSTSGLTGIVEYDPADQVIVVRAGTRLADLVARLREDRLMLPFDPPGLARATVGGVIAANVSGPLRAGYGPPRDHVLGTRAAHPDGKLTRSGGRLVKNVTGFDLHRLYCGSQGSLAVLCEIALRLRPVPEHQATIGLVAADAEGLDRLLARFRACRDDVVSVAAVDAETLDRIGAPRALHENASHALLIRVFGLQRAVETAAARFQEVGHVAEALRIERIEGADEDGIWSAIREMRSKLDPRGRGAVLRIDLRVFGGDASNITCDVAGLLDAIYTACAGEGSTPGLHLEPVSGVLRIHLPTPPSDALLGRLMAHAEPASERRVSIESAPATWRMHRDVHCGRLPNGGWMKRLKRALDPNLILSPGRLCFGGEA